MDLAIATQYARQILNWLEPHCLRIQVAGSIRRHRPLCNDIDIVCIPKLTEEKDMLGTVIGRTNHCLAFLQKYVSERTATVSETSRSNVRFISGGDREGKQLILQLPKCQLDLWFACERTFANRLLLRTGSKEHNAWLATRAADYGLHWFIYYGFARENQVTLGTTTGEQAFNAGLIQPATTEADLYRQVGLELILPENRESAWLTKNIDSGLPV